MQRVRVRVRVRVQRVRHRVRIRARVRVRVRVRARVRVRVRVHLPSGGGQGHAVQREGRAALQVERVCPQDADRAQHRACARVVRLACPVDAHLVRERVRVSLRQPHSLRRDARSRVSTAARECGLRCVLAWRGCSHRRLAVGRLRPRRQHAAGLDHFDKAPCQRPQRTHVDGSCAAEGARRRSEASRHGAGDGRQERGAETFTLPRGLIERILPPLRLSLELWRHV